MPQALTYDVRALLANALRREPHAAPPPPRAEWPSLLDTAQQDGVLPLLAAAAARAGWPRDLAAAMRPGAAASAALAVVHEREARRVFSSLDHARVSPLLLKGAHLAYAVYDSPALRPRLDTDVLVRDDQCDRLRVTLMDLGYAPVPHVTGVVAFGQFQYGRTDESGARHTIDVHRRISNPQAFAERLTYDELSDDAIAVPALAPNARGPALWRALILACVHRTAHHGTSSRLIWLYDIHLLAGRLTSHDWDCVVDAAARKGLAPVIAAGLVDTVQAFDTALPASLLQRLHDFNAAADRDVIAFLESPPSLLRIAASDWRRLRSWRGRARFVREHLFPSPSYIRHRYGISSPVALPLLYAHRIASGAIRHLRP
jgi:hypothetical protein